MKALFSPYVAMNDLFIHDSESLADVDMEGDHATPLFLNRALMTDRVAHAMLRTQRNGQRLLLCCIDIDQQLTLHDVYGDEGIRELLAQIGSRIQGVLRAVDSLGQLQNRTLALLLEGIDDWKDVDTVLQKILLCFAHPVIIDEQSHTITASIGVTEFDGASNIETAELFEQAEFACYRARRRESLVAVKEEHGSEAVVPVSEGQGYAFFGGHLMARNSVQKLLARNIMDGFNRNEFAVYFQPVIQLEHPACYAIESLMRWHHPKAGNILPAMFLQLLEENKLTKNVGDRMMQLACQTWQQLIKNGKIAADVKLSLNIHQDQVDHADFIGSIKSLLSTFNIADKQLILEFKGKTVMQPTSNNGFGIIAKLQQLQDLGVLICVDNFGEMDAPLMCLQKLPLDIIKLAHGLVSDIENCPQHLLLIKHMRMLCQQLNIEMIVQAVDSAEKITQLTQIGCTLLQGNYLGEASAAADLKTFWG